MSGPFQHVIEAAVKRAETALWSVCVAQEIDALEKRSREPRRTPTDRIDLFGELSDVSGELVIHLSRALELRARLMRERGLDPEPVVDQLLGIVRKEALGPTAPAQAGNDNTAPTRRQEPRSPAADGLWDEGSDNE